MDHPILAHVALGYSPIIDRDRAVTAVRLQVFPRQAGQPLDAGQLLAAVAEVWPAGGAPVALSVRSESLLADLLRAKPAANVMVEVPHFMAGDPAHADALVSLHSRGVRLLLSGRPNAPLPGALLPCFSHAIIDLADDRRLDEAPDAPRPPRSIGFWQDGVRTVADMEGSFRRGAQAVLGWPIDEVTASGPQQKAGRPDLQVIVELIQRVDKEEPIDRLEATLRRDPTLAYKLMRYINSAAFGLTVEITSFGHAIMMLGYQRLKRWLALLLATASKDANLRPVMYAAVRRGLILERLVGPDADSDLRSEIFICGVFSLLDRMFQQPFGELLKSIPVSQPIYQALAEDAGPHAPWLHLVQAIESGTGHDIRELTDQMLLSPEQVNAALLVALGQAAQLD